MAEYQVKWDITNKTFVATIGGSDYQAKRDKTNKIFVVTYSGSDYQVKRDKTNKIFVVDVLTNYTVLKTDASFNIIWRYDTGGTYAFDVALDSSGNVWVVGIRSGSKSVWKLDSDGNLLDSWDTGNDTYQVAIDGSDNVYVGGLASGGYSIWKIASGSISGFFNAGTVWGLITDASGNVYVAPGGAARKINSGGTSQWTYGSGNNVSIGLNSSGNVLVGNSSVHKLTELDNNGNYLNDHAEINWNPRSLVIDGSNNIFVAGWSTVADHTVIKFNSGLSIIANALITNVVCTDCKLDSGGNLWTTGGAESGTGYTVVKFNSSLVEQNGYDYGDDANGIAIDGSDNLYVTGKRVPL